MSGMLLWDCTEVLQGDFRFVSAYVQGNPYFAAICASGQQAASASLVTASSFTLHEMKELPCGCSLCVPPFTKGQ